MNSKLFLILSFGIFICLFLPNISMGAGCRCAEVFYDASVPGDFCVPPPNRCGWFYDIVGSTKSCLIGGNSEREVWCNPEGNNCDIGGIRCEENTCPAESGRNGENCYLRTTCGSACAHWPEEEPSVSSLKWDASEYKCVECVGNKESKIWGDTGGIYCGCTNDSVGGDGQCESACGADPLCDEKNPWDWVDGGVCNDNCIWCPAAVCGGYNGYWSDFPDWKFYNVNGVFSFDGCAYEATKNCDDDDGCYSYGTGCEERNYSCSDGSCTYSYSNRNTDECVSYGVSGCAERDWYCSGSSCTYIDSNQNDDHCVGDDWYDYYCSGSSCTYTISYDDPLCAECTGTLNVSIIGSGTCTVTADLSASNCDGKSWEVKDDGTRKCPSAGPGTVSGSSYSYTCPSWTVGVGSYTYNLYIDGGLKDSDSVTCSSTPPPNNPPTCTSLTPDKTSVNVDDTVVFTGAGSDSDGTIVQYEFDFGDGSSKVYSSTAGATHVYTATTGSPYCAKLRVKDDDGAWGTNTGNCPGGTCTVQITVTEIAPCTVTCELDDCPNTLGITTGCDLLLYYDKYENEDGSISTNEFLKAANDYNEDLITEEEATFVVYHSGEINSLLNCPGCYALPTYTLTVTTAGTGSGTVVSSDTYINCGTGGTDCSKNYESGTSVTLTAYEDAGSTFDHWSGACSGTGISCILTMNSAKTVTATFVLAGPENCCNDIDDDGDGKENGYDSGCQNNVSLSKGSNSICWWTEWNNYGNSRDYYSGWYSCPSGYGVTSINITQDTEQAYDFFWAYGTGDVLIYKDSGPDGTKNITPGSLFRDVRFRFTSDSSSNFDGVKVNTITCSPLSAEICCNDTDDDGDGYENGEDSDCQNNVNLAAGSNSICWWTRWDNYLNNSDYYSGWFTCPAGYYVGIVNIYQSIESSLYTDYFYMYDTGMLERYKENGIYSGDVNLSSYNTQRVKFRFTSDPFTNFDGVKVNTIGCWSGAGAKPDFIIEDIWNEENTIYYRIKNQGGGSAPGDVWSGLWVDGGWITNDRVYAENLEAGESATESFNYSWACSDLEDEIKVQADWTDSIEETIEGNNIREEPWQCPAFTLLGTITGTGLGTVSVNPPNVDYTRTTTDVNFSETYTVDTSVTLTPTAASGSYFAGWSGACSGTGTCTLTMNANKNVTATFHLITYTLTVFKAGTGSGNININPPNANCGTSCLEDLNSYPSGTAVVLTATPDPNSTFASWSGDCFDWNYRKTITIDNTGNPTSLTDYQVLVTVDNTASLISAGKMQNDCDDIRFTDSDGANLNYWLESGCNTASTKIWVKIPSIPANSQKTIYMYYGNSSANLMSNQFTTNVFQLREHDYYGPPAYPDNDPIITFIKSGTTKIKMDSVVGSSGDGYAFLVVPRNWLDNKYLRWNWQGYFSSSADRVISYVYIRDGVYDRKSSIDFPEGAEVNSIPSKGSGTLLSYSGPNTYSYWGPDTVDLLIDVSGGTEEYCTIMFKLHDAWDLQNLYVEIDWVEINTGSGGAGNIHTIHFTEDINMEVTGTFNDYGLFRKYTSTEPSSSIGVEEELTENCLVIMDADKTVTATFNSVVGLPTVTTNPATNISTTTAYFWGYIDDDGGEASDGRFNWGDTAAYGNNTSWILDRTTGASFISGQPGLTKGKTYHFRAEAQNSAGGAYGLDETFITLPDPPTNLTATPISPSRIDLSWTKGAGAVNTMVRRGLAGGACPASETDGTQVYYGTGTSISDTGLAANTTYCYRAWSEAAEETLTVYSEEYAEDSATTLTIDNPPTAAISLSPPEVNITGQPNDQLTIDVSGSTDDVGISQVRFLSDDIQDGVPTGSWTPWYDWDNSSGDWDAVTKIMSWYFSTCGDKEVWVEVKDSSAQTDQVSANTYVNCLPTADAGPNKQILETETTILEGSGSDSDGFISSYSWSCDSGSLSDSNIAQPTFTPPDVGSDTTFTCDLTVTDDYSAQASDTIDVLVEDVGGLTYTLNVSQGTINFGSNGSGTVSFDPPDPTIYYPLPHSKSYAPDTNVILTANPDIDSYLYSWTGDCSGTTNPCSLTMDSDKNVIVYFRLIPLILSVVTTGTGSGTVRNEDNSIICGTDGSDCFEWYDSGTSATLTATPDSGSYFAGWTDDYTGTDNPYTLIVRSGDKHLTAIFHALPDTIIDSGPDSPTNETTPTLTFHGTNSPTSYQCQLNGGGWSECTSPRTYPVSQGTHTFEVKAINVGGEDPTPASWTWLVDTTDPVVTAFDVSPTSLNIDNPQATISWTVTDAGGSHVSHVEVWRTVDLAGAPDDTQWQKIGPDYSAPADSDSWSSSAIDSPSDGIYWYGIHVVDEAGNSATEPTPIQVTVDKTPPPPPTCDPPGGDFINSITVTCSCSETGATIRYTTSAGVSIPPTTDSPEYTAPLTLTDITILTVASWDSAGNRSTDKSYTYIITIDTTDPTTAIKIFRISPWEDVTGAEEWLKADDYTIQFEDEDSGSNPSGLKSCGYYVYDTQASTYVVSFTSRTCGNWSFNIAAGTSPYHKEGVGVYLIYTLVIDNADLLNDAQIGLNFDFTPPETWIE